MEYFDSRKKRYVKLDKISFNLTITNILLKDNSGKSDPESGVEDIDWKTSNVIKPATTPKMFHFSLLIKKNEI